jgi:hypothetical protein
MDMVIVWNERGLTGKRVSSRHSVVCPPGPPVEESGAPAPPQEFWVFHNSMFHAADVVANAAMAAMREVVNCMLMVESEVVKILVLRCMVVW